MNAFNLTDEMVDLVADDLWNTSKLDLEPELRTSMFWALGKLARPIDKKFFAVTDLI